MFRTMIRGIRSLAGASTKLVAVAAAAAIASAAVVSADGGDTSQIHACLLADPPPGAGNVRIVGADEPCPGGTTTVHWSVSGPPGAQGPEGDPGGVPAEDLDPPTGGSEPPSPKVYKKLYKPLGIKKITPKNTKVVSASEGPEPVAKERAVSAYCPGSHPFAIEGWFEMIPAAPGVELGASSTYPVGFHGWEAYVVEAGTGTFGGKEPGPWTLKVSVRCVKGKIPSG